MDGDEKWFPSHVKELDRTECLELVSARRVGRVAYCDALGPVVLTVNYVMDHDTILFRVSPHSTLAHNLRSAPASFQVDDYEEYNQSGWSVLFRGEATYVEPTELPDADSRPFAWAEGQRTLHVRITPHDITGRRLLPA